MLYLLFFLLRDGHDLADKIRSKIPLADNQKTRLLTKFMGVIRATVKGNLVVALVQGGLGGLIFWFLGIEAALLWGAIMSVLSLLPAGSGVVWLCRHLFSVDRFHPERRHFIGFRHSRYRPYRQFSASITGRQGYPDA